MGESLNFASLQSSKDLLYNNMHTANIIVQLKMFTIVNLCYVLFFHNLKKISFHFGKYVHYAVN